MMSKKHQAKSMNIPDLGIIYIFIGKRSPFEKKTKKIMMCIVQILRIQILLLQGKQVQHNIIRTNYFGGMSFPCIGGYSDSDAVICELNNLCDVSTKAITWVL